jgi:hypothetical protein
VGTFSYEGSGAVPFPANGLSPEQAVTELARRLYWNMNRLDPDPDSPEWDGLTERERRFYYLLVDDLVGSRELIRTAQGG